MSRVAASILTRTYAVDPARIDVIAHGVPDLALVASDAVKPLLGLSGRQVILSFGLLGPGKGYEAAIAAMPGVVQAVPTALYVILGATHPDLLRREGEAYRRKLEATAAALGMTDHVRFMDRFVGPAELGTWLTAADLFVTPYPNLDQIVSGTLSYAMAAAGGGLDAVRLRAGAPGARARRAGGGGSLGALARAFIDLLLDPERRAAIGPAYEESRTLVWPAVAGSTVRSSRGRPACAADRLRPLPLRLPASSRRFRARPDPPRVGGLRRHERPTDRRHERPTDRRHGDRGGGVSR